MTRLVSRADKQAWIGCSGWNYRDWRETFYPKGLPAKRWLEHYSTLFRTVEVNNTFYRLPNVTAVEGWAEQTPDDFVFTVKASRYLTHIKRLTDMSAGVERFYERIEPLITAGKLGPVLWQLPGNSIVTTAVSRQQLNDCRRTALLRVSPRQLVHRRGLRAVAGAQRRSRDRRPPRPALSDVRADGLDVFALPPRPSWP